MKNFKALLIVVLLVCTASANAQSSDSKGFTVQAYLGMYMEEEELMSYDCNQVFNVSIADGYLVHNIITDNLVSNAQLYKISEVVSSVENGESTFSFVATSGLSGSTYNYTVSLGADDTATITLVQPDGKAIIYMASSAVFKTFNK